jgi:8-oxo-dGTP diphosphatase
MIQERPKLGIGVLVWNPRGRLLLGQRRGAHAAGEFWLPGGKPDGGESPRDAAVRELYEETSISVVRDAMEPLDFWTYDRFEADDLHYVTVYYQCKLPFGEMPRLLEPEKCYGWGWYSTWAPGGYGSLPTPHYSRLLEVIENA